ncbi:kinetochore Sim4 complex subunit FTA2-domain-containing protein [Chaetomium fimeti]|uniref:Kinetochore Sim4 complex subunit FTA2-domain-containing protein n=1 Tax=Chaetomium fimeti TaxID=1854472 RepID=A0AAE0LNL3_9PEZI|nr:kinetochore Sim4 complex subunit FTA2-domain-containing protein [Chaetomium fimeti]
MSLPPSPRLPKPLPQVPGPKLVPFTRTAHAVIQFVKELGSPGQDGRVWEVTIKGKPYALKMFMFCPTDYLRDDLAGHLVRDLSSPRFYTDYFDPFSCECRAYGRLKEENREHLAVRSHGYLLLTPAQELEITRSIAGSEPSRSNIWDRSEEHQHLPIQAIVKDLAESQEPFTAKQVPDMWADLKELHELGILVRDIRIFNYLGGKLIDFSRSWSTPHPGYAALYWADEGEERSGDAHGLNKAVIEWGIGNHWDWDEVVIPDEMVNCASGRGPNQYGVDPRLYNWLKWEKNPVAASAFLEEHVLEKPVDNGEYLRTWGV